MALKGYINNKGHLVLPDDVVAEYGLYPGAEILMEREADSLIVSRSISHLSTIYLEPTNQCNLHCNTCIRNVWEEPLGRMEMETYDRVLSGIKEIPSIRTIFFGGYGEPLSHPDIIPMLRRAKQAGIRVELITNGTLLTEKIVGELIDLKLDCLWVSLDGATPETYTDIRVGAELSSILNNLENLHRHRLLRSSPYPEIGISFVAMKKNIKDLPRIISIVHNIRASKLSISNVLPYTKSLKDELLYEKSGSGWRLGYCDLSLPRMDIDDVLAPIIKDLIFWFDWSGLAGQSRERRRDHCPFVSRGSTSIRWDGHVSPCQPLMYTYRHFLGDHERENRSFFVGSLVEDTLLDIWNEPEYISLRQKLTVFDFSPCTECNSCELAEHNREDCMGNHLPACGGCLWAQGFINCP